MKQLQHSHGKVVHFDNQDLANWVEQHIQRRVYIELGIKAIGSDTCDIHKSWDDMQYVYCLEQFPSRLTLTYHQVGGRHAEPISFMGDKLELPSIYPNIYIAKQGKDLKIVLQRGDIDHSQFFHVDEYWSSSIPSLRRLKCHWVHAQSSGQLQYLGYQVQVKMIQDYILTLNVVMGKS